MRTFITLALVAAAPALFAAGGNQSTATADVAVKIVAPISLVNPNNSAINFGIVTVNDPTKPIEVQFVPTNEGGIKTLKYTNSDPYADKEGSKPSSFAWFHVRKDHNVDWSNVGFTVPGTVTLGTGVKVITAKSDLTQCTQLLGQPVFLSNTTYADLRHFYVGGTLQADANTFGEFKKTITVTAYYQ